MKLTKMRVGLAVVVVVCLLGLWGWWTVASRPYIRFVRFERKDRSIDAVFRLVNPSSQPISRFQSGVSLAVWACRVRVGNEVVTMPMIAHIGSDFTEIPPKGQLEFRKWVTSELKRPFAVGVSIPGPRAGKPFAGAVSRFLDQCINWGRTQLDRFGLIGDGLTWSDYTPVPPATP
jgi:4-amino-4-deoxy-L-arabinose transferase-like glycosyltransferase